MLVCSIPMPLTTEISCRQFWSIRHSWLLHVGSLGCLTIVVLRMAFVVELWRHHITAMLALVLRWILLSLVATVTVVVSWPQRLARSILISFNRLLSVSSLSETTIWVIPSVVVVVDNFFTRVVVSDRAVLTIDVFTAVFTFVLVARFALIIFFFALFAIIFTTSVLVLVDWSKGSRWRSLAWLLSAERLLKSVRV